jgi:hypothetical protein
MFWKDMSLQYRPIKATADLVRHSQREGYHVTFGDSDKIVSNVPTSEAFVDYKVVEVRP